MLFQISMVYSYKKHKKSKSAIVVYQGFLDPT